jgi:hypothetical protein
MQRSPAVHSPTGGHPLSITLQALLVVAAAVAVTLAGRAMLGRFLRPDRIAAAQPTADVVVEAMAGLYGVLVAFLLSGVWERFDHVRDTVTNEANALAELRQVARTLPAPAGDAIRAGGAAYLAASRAELPLLARGGRSPQVDSSADRLWRTVADFEPASPGQTELQTRAFDALEELGNERRLRLDAVGRALPPILWIILVGGAAAVLAVVAITSADGRIPAVYLALLAAVISFALFAIYAFSYPGRSGLVTSLAPFAQALGPP